MASFGTRQSTKSVPCLSFRGSAKGLALMVIVAICAMVAPGAAFALRPNPCLLSVGKGLSRVHKVQGKEAHACWRDAGRGRLGAGVTVQSCLGADARGKVALQEERFARDEEKHCVERLSWGFTGHANGVSAARHAALAASFDLFGSDVNTALRTDASGARCQAALVKRTNRLADMQLREFERCFKLELKNGLPQSRADVGACLAAVADDARGRIARAASRLESDFDKHCASLPQSEVLPGTCRDAEDAGSCLEAASRCRVCRLVSQAYGADGACDLFDDGSENLSCNDEAPQAFENIQRMPVSGQGWFVNPQEACASDTNDGHAATCSAGSGPWKTLLPLVTAPIAAGDAIHLGTATYALGKTTASIAAAGTPTEPVRIQALPGSSPVLDGGWTPQTAQPGNTDPVVRLASPYQIWQGIRVEGCNMVCVQAKEGSEHFVWRDMVVVGGGEDGIKATLSRLGLIHESEFTGFHGEAIDVWGSHHYWLVGNEFHSNDTSFRAPSSAVWSKGGSTDVHWARNHFRDLQIGTNALMLGGCCWHHWQGDNAPLLYENGAWVAQPMARQVHAEDNLFERVRIHSSSVAPWPGAIGVNACWQCSAKGNSILDSDVAFGIQPTVSSNQPCTATADCQANPQECTCQWSVLPRDLELRDNHVAGLADYGDGTARLVHAHADVPVEADARSLVIDQNLYCTDLPATCRVGGSTAPAIDFASWQALGFDQNSTLTTTAGCPGGTGGGWLDGLFFASGFEAATTIVDISAAAGDIVGDDASTLLGDWEADLETYDPVGAARIFYEDGTTADREVSLVADPDDPTNQVLLTELRSPAIRLEGAGGLPLDDEIACNGDPLGSRKGRIQVSLRNNVAFHGVEYEVRLRLGSGFASIAQAGQEIHWLTLAEFWNESPGEPDHTFRVTLGLHKEYADSDGLYWVLKADEKPTPSSSWVKLWTPGGAVSARQEAVSTDPVEAGEWIRLRLRMIEGNAETGRAQLFQVEGDGTVRTLIDVQDWTHDPEDTAPDGFQMMQPIKLYTSGGLICGLKAATGESLEIWWDDFAIGETAAASPAAAFVDGPVLY